MAENSKIAWTDHTFNPWLGCTKVAPECARCYAENLMDTRYGKVKWGPQGTRVKTTDAYWRKPLKWNRDAERAGVRAKVFCASLADVFEEWKGPIHASNGFEIVVQGNGIRATHVNGPRIHPLTMGDLRSDLFAMIDATPWLDWLLLTKRPENVLRMWPGVSVNSQQQAEDRNERGELYRRNVWLGTSIGQQDQVHRWDALAECRDLARFLWISAEPLLGPLDLQDLTAANDFPDWIVFGGESDQGAKARPCLTRWIRDGVHESRQLGIVPFVKQLGSNVDVELKDKAGADPGEWPVDLRVREFPEVAHA